MNRKVVFQPCIVIDFSRNRIRIFKNAFRAVGNPEYFLLLINPEERTIAILPSDSSDKRSHRTTKDAIDRHQSYELYSRPLLQSLLKMSDSWHPMQAYRLHGEIINGQAIVKFSMDNFYSIRELSPGVYGGENDI